MLNDPYELFFDMDGVMADWCRAFDARFGEGAAEQFDSLNKEDKNLIKEELANGNFYRHLPVMEKGVSLVIEMVRSGRKVSILTSVGRQNPENVVRQKKAWVSYVYPADVAAVLLENFHYTLCSEDKAAFARPNVCLVDDRAKSRIPFIAAGGVAVDIADL
ncbi:hypothetical protein [Aeromonas phage AS-yj]|uniref:Uncharacterized protein n=5 Tax=Caudoviricetes TaxID=2731619 RepID=A0A291LDN3_9CAUD|nr:5'-3' deoxyribonucleotidase [Aeromonas phage AS-sw]ATI17441.1 hypothetical protein [Aeromonas phage AS-szw]ATI17653.1 hypothetical protein [Aeromonas phage AS-yj]QAX97881.1 hypothetical protein ASswx1_238 [Aeromonas phage Asswx_1]QAX99068.1 hypothetical protein assk_280 [Aeromonas phage Assk]QMV29098.1 hypothetical protein AP1_0391 [Aeromonas phage AP1]UKM62509.1 hypothetical protein P19_0021 [Aeromonas phage P19]